MLLSTIEGTKCRHPRNFCKARWTCSFCRRWQHGEMHGWGVAQRIQQVSKDVLQIGQGSLYPALHRLEYKGWIRSDWGNSENNRRAKFYSLTRAGKKRLETELEDWDRLSAAVALVLGRIPEASS